MKNIGRLFFITVFLCFLSFSSSQAGDAPKILGVDWSPERGAKISKDPLGATCTSDDGASTCKCAGGCWGNETNCGCTQGKGIPFKQSQAQALDAALKGGSFQKSGKSLKIGEYSLKAMGNGYLAPGIQPPVKSATCTSGDGNSTCECDGFCKAGQTTCRCGQKQTLQAGWGDGLRIQSPGD